eukprot:2990449-Ditylum_brightwellii.AAC.1
MAHGPSRLTDSPMEVSRKKAHLCVRSDQQIKDVDYFETFLPVVSWSTVRMVITLVVDFGLKSKQVDYTNAFVQTDLPKEEEVYMAFPHGWEEPGKVLKLTKT